jgi:hypothetical protein
MGSGRGGGAATTKSPAKNDYGAKPAGATEGISEDVGRHGMSAAVLTFVGIGVLSALVLGVRQLKVARKTLVNREEQALKFAQRLFHKESLDQLTTDEALQIRRLTEQFFL